MEPNQAELIRRAVGPDPRDTPDAPPRPAPLFDPQPIYEREHRFASILDGMMHVGVGFDEDGLMPLVGKLETRQTELREMLIKTLPQQVRFTPKKGLRRESDINPNSRDQVAQAFIDLYGWKPTAWSRKTGKPTLDEDALGLISSNQVPILAEVMENFSLVKILGQVIRGPKSLIKNSVRLPDGQHRIYQYCGHNGTRTHRCAHGVVANIPRPTTRWGPELRGVFIPRRGWKMVGADADGIEARGMAHYLVPWDNGRLAKFLPEGDIHTRVFEACKQYGVKSRDDSKTSFYATTFGARAATVGAYNGVSEQLGHRIQQAILSEGVPGLGHLIARVSQTYRARGYLFSLDGRRSYPAKLSSAFNTLIQSFGAIVMKQATVNLVDLMAELGHPLGTLWNLVIHYHDEFAAECRPDVAELVRVTMERAIEKAGEDLGVQCLLAASGKTGNSWAEVH